MIVQTRSGGPLQALGCLFFGALFMAGAFFLAKWTLEFIWWACLGFFVAALIIDWTVVRDTGTWFVRTLRSDPLRAIIYGVLGIVCFPLLAFSWFLGAIAKNRMKSFASRFEQDFRQMGGRGANPFEPMQSPSKDDDYVDYEEIETKKKEL
jgi:hypothetical protein